MSKLIIALVAGTAALFASNAIAAPLNPKIPLQTDLENVRLVCDQSGRCWRERGARRVIIQRESYGYDRRRRGHDRHHNHDRPTVGFHAPGVSIGVGGGRW